MTARIKAAQVGRQHVGKTVRLPGVKGPTHEHPPLTGILRWVTHTSDESVLAVEADEDEGAIEWRLVPDEEVNFLD